MRKVKQSWSGLGTPTETFEVLGNALYQSNGAANPVTPHAVCKKLPSALPLKLLFFRKTFGIAFQMRNIYAIAFNH